MNRGLVNALNSVGKDLFGAAVFSAYVPPNPLFPVNVFLADNSRISAAVNVFVPPNPIIPTDPCRSYVRVSVDPADGVRVTIDEVAAAAADFNPETDVQYASLASEQPNTAQCPAPAPIDPSP